jgi:hypothetical protein
VGSASCEFIGVTDEAAKAGLPVKRLSAGLGEFETDEPVAGQTVFSFVLSLAKERRQRGVVLFTVAGWLNPSVGPAL